MIFLISCIAGVFGSFCRMPDSHHWSRHVDCWCVRQNLCAGGISNNFLLKNNDIWLYFWYSFLHLKFHFSCYCQKLSPLVWPVFLHSKNKKNSISYFFSRNLSGPGPHHKKNPQFQFLIVFKRFESSCLTCVFTSEKHKKTQILNFFKESWRPHIGTKI